MDYPLRKKQAWAKVSGPTGGINLADALTVDVPYPVHGDRWGNWEFDAERLLLVYHSDQIRDYEVPVREMSSCGQMLDWIFQVNSKTWAGRKDIGDLVQALDDLFDPQATLCSGGQEKQIDPSKYLRDRLSRGKAI